MGGRKKLKEPKKFEEQLKILKDRNMIIENDEEAIKILAQTNYYRLTAYALQFKEDDNYNNKITFNDMYRLYKFDKKLRNLMLGILEHIEISLRTYMAYTLALKYGSEAHTNTDIYKNVNFYLGYDDSNDRHHKGLKDEIKNQIFNNRKELLVKHHMDSYKEHFPTWVIVEILSFGMLSKMYSNLNTTDQKIIARNGFGTNHILLESWIRNLAYIRNICAHYSRLYNKKFAINPSVHRKYTKHDLESEGLFLTILAIKELTINSLEWETFNIQLEALIDEYVDVVDLKLIGFPNNWRDILNV